MYKHYTQVPKKPLGQAAKIARLNKSAHQPKPPTEEYSEGWFNGLIGEIPMYPENDNYWSGYSLGNREYWCSQKGVELSERF